MTDQPTPAACASTQTVDSAHPAVRERAVSLYLAVRDGFRYDPYRIDLSPQGMRASTVLANGYGWCVPKAVLLTAACRAAGIPARLGFADVRNHLSTERMRQTMKTDLFIWHGYADIWLDGRWVKATPAFNMSLCERFGLLPLDFDGRTAIRSTTPSTARATATWNTCTSAAASTTCRWRRSLRRFSPGLWRVDAGRPPLQTARFSARRGEGNTMT
jgi:transglutaminase-like putative cysteine protease